MPFHFYAGHDFFTKDWRAMTWIVFGAVRICMLMHTLGLAHFLKKLFQRRPFEVSDSFFAQVSLRIGTDV
jgi:hypothetical protein